MRIPVRGVAVGVDQLKKIFCFMCDDQLWRHYGCENNNWNAVTHTVLYSHPIYEHIRG